MIFIYFTGVFFAPVIERYGSHPQLALWGVLMFISLILSACATNIYMMYITYGVLLGNENTDLFFAEII